MTIPLNIIFNNFIISLDLNTSLNNTSYRNINIEIRKKPKKIYIFIYKITFQYYKKKYILI